MSNVNSPFGFRHLGYPEGGAVTNYGLTWKKIAAAYGTALYRGDVLIDLGSGYCGRYTNGALGSNVVGIVEGFEYLSTATGRRTPSTYLPTGDTAYDVDVCLTPIMGVPPQLFIVQAAATNFTIADIGMNIEPYLGGTGTAAGGFGKSSMTIVQGTNEAATATLPFRIVDLYSRYAPLGINGTDDTSNYNIVVVSSNPFNATGIA
jgi:hypothetical protein